MTDSSDEMAAKGAKGRGKGGKPTPRGEEAENIHKAVLEVLERFNGNRTLMAKACQVSQPTVTRWVDGTSVPAVENVDVIAKILGRTADDVRRGLRPIEEGGVQALDVAIFYWAGKWPADVVAKARKLCDGGERHAAQGWAAKMDELAKR